MNLEVDLAKLGYALESKDRYYSIYGTSSSPFNIKVITDGKRGQIYMDTFLNVSVDTQAQYDKVEVTLEAMLDIYRLTWEVLVRHDYCG